MTFFNALKFALASCLAVTSKAPHPLFKQYPAMAAMKGLEAMEFDIWAGVHVHKNTPDSVVLPARAPSELARVYENEIERYRAIAKSIQLQPQ